MTHYLKIQMRWLAAREAHQKFYELRINDRDFQRGDSIIFTLEGSDQTLKEKYEITHVLTSDVCEGLKKGYCILSLTKLI